METATFFLVFGIVIMVFLAMARIENERVGVFEYQARPALFSPEEKSFLDLLEDVVGERARVYGKIRAASVMAVEKGVGARVKGIADDRLSDMYFDFVLCQAETVEPICVIDMQMDEGLMGSSGRRRKTDFVDKVCQSAGMPLVRVRAGDQYSKQEIRKKLEKFL